MPTVSPDKVIGIRTPVLRKFAKDFGKRAEAESFLKNLPHKYNLVVKSYEYHTAGRTCAVCAVSTTVLQKKRIYGPCNSDRYVIGIEREELL